MEIFINPQYEFHDNGEYFTINNNVGGSIIYHCTLNYTRITGQENLFVCLSDTGLSYTQHLILALPVKTDLVANYSMKIFTEKLLHIDDYIINMHEYINRLNNKHKGGFK